MECSDVAYLWSRYDLHLVGLKTTCVKWEIGTIFCFCRLSEGNRILVHELF